MIASFFTPAASSALMSSTLHGIRAAAGGGCACVGEACPGVGAWVTVPAVAAVGPDQSYARPTHLQPPQPDPQSMRLCRRGALPPVHPRPHRIPRRQLIFAFSIRDGFGGSVRSNGRSSRFLGCLDGFLHRRSVETGRISAVLRAFRAALDDSGRSTLLELFQSPAKRGCYRWREI